MKNPDGGSSGRTNPGADWNPHDVREVLMDFEGTEQSGWSEAVYPG